MKEQICIVGAGLVGISCALHLAKKNGIIDVYESRTLDEVYLNEAQISYNSGRAMSMDLSARGIYAMEYLGLYEEIKKYSVPMFHKIFHDQDGQLTHIPYSSKNNQHILTIGRARLFQILFDAAKKFKDIRFHFQHQCENIDFSNLKVIFNNLSNHAIVSVRPNILIGADGSNSQVRKLFEKHTNKLFKITQMPQSYKELSIPPEMGQKLEHTAMHLWSRDEIMLAAQPNLDHSFTCALLMPEKQKMPSFENIHTPEQIEDFFDNYFPDAKSLIPNLVKQYTEHKVNHLKILQGETWITNGNTVLIGDAAHGMVPFFGQGVNCGFEDCTVLLQCLDETGFHWPTALTLFDRRRVDNSNAISSMSYVNYPELLNSNIFSKVLLKKQIEVEISKAYPDEYISYHNLVCFSRVPYIYAQECKKLQDAILERLSYDIQHINQLDWSKVAKEVSLYKQKIHNFNGVKDNAV